MPAHPELESASRSKSTRKQAAHDVRPLKRNAACHQCRKRKMKCDARRPCTACLRSHGHLVDHAPAGTELPPYPDCTYDTVTDLVFDDEPKTGESSRQLEEKIGKLEELLRDMTIQLEKSRSSPNNDQLQVTSSTSTSVSPEPSHATQRTPVTKPKNSKLTFSYGLTDELTALPNAVPPQNNEVTQVNLYDERLFAVTPSGWSLHLPDPATTRHMVQMFFKFNIHANRIFHAPTFLASLDLHPMDPRFPPVAVLHAFCALGSMYTSEKAPDYIYTNIGFPYVAINGRWVSRPVRPYSFAVHHSRLAWQALAKYFESGDHLLQETQTHILLVLFDMHRALWSDVFRNAGEAIKGVIPLGLANCAPFKIPRSPMGMAGPIVQASMILPPAENTIEEEMRRNIFWMTYVVDRQQSLGRDLALALDDRDIGQMLPVRGDYFHYGVQVPTEERQWSADPNLLLHHPPQHTDSFILYVKASILISRVKNFNVRYRARYYVGDPYMCDLDTHPAVRGVEEQRKLLDSLERFDPRGTQAFKELDHLVASFKASFPREFCMPVRDGRVDAHLYSALIVSHLAAILLHDPHVKFDDPTCPSRPRLAHACQGILELIYLISSTTYDVSLLDHFAITGWYFAGRELARFLRAAIRDENVEDILTFCGELNDIDVILGRAEVLLPTAQQYRRMLTNVISQTCGEQYVPGQTSWMSVPAAAHPASTQDTYVPHAYSDVEFASLLEETSTAVLDT